MRERLENQATIQEHYLLGNDRFERTMYFIK
jgi:hypothetical protein